MARGKSLDDNQLTDSMYYILLSLIEPLHGYGIKQKISDLSAGKIEIGPASLYTILKKLVTRDLIVLLDDNENRKKTYQISQSGRVLLKLDIERRIQMAEIGKSILNEL
jgi:DNA-binding PadR family transcriptional regulator